MTNPVKTQRLPVSKNTLRVWGAFAVLLFLAGFRWDVGVDWQNYMDMFNNGSPVLLFESRTEPGNIILSVLLNLGGMKDAGYWIFAMACLTLYITFFSILRQSEDSALSIILYICMGMFFFPLNGIRQGAAMAITTLCWPLIIERRFVRFLIVTLIASCFHSTALIMIPTYFLCNIKLNARLLLILGIVAVPLSFVMASAILEKVIALIPLYEVYSSEVFTSVGNQMSILRVIYPFSLLLFILNVYDKITCDRRSLVFTNLTIYYIFFVLLFPGLPLADRLSFYFQLALVVFIPLVCGKMMPSNANLLKYYTIFYGIGLVTVTMLLRPSVNLLPFELDIRLAGWPLWIMLMCVIAISALFARWMSPLKSTLKNYT